MREAGVSAAGAGKLSRLSCGACRAWTDARALLYKRYGEGADEGSQSLPGESAVVAASMAGAQ